MSATAALLVVLESQDKICRFLIKHDWSSILLKFDLPSNYNLELVGLLPQCRGEQPWEAQLRRLLGARHLALQYDRWLAETGQGGLAHIDLLPSAYRSRHRFLEHHNLPPTDRVRKILAVGERILRIERNIGVRGISLMLLPIFSTFSDMSRKKEDEIVNLLVSHATYSGTIQIASIFSTVLDYYQVWYSRQVMPNCRDIPANPLGSLPRVPAV